jgi:hypothetical protein
MSNSKNLAISSETTLPIPPDLRNDIYAALISGGGLRAIEGTLEHELQASGWIADLKVYITHLLRSGECTTVKEIEAKVHEKIAQSAGKEGGNARRNNTEEESGSENGSVMGNGVTNGNGVNGNGNGINGHSTDDLNLRIPNKAIVEGVQVIRRELNKICDITVAEE